MARGKKVSPKNLLVGEPVQVRGLIIFRNAGPKWGKGRVRRCEIGKSMAYIPVAKWGIRARTFGRFLQMRGGVKKHRF